MEKMEKKVERAGGRREGMKGRNVSAYNYYVICWVRVSWGFC